MTEVGRVSVTEEEGKKRFIAIGVAVMIVCGVRRERERVGSLDIQTITCHSGPSENSFPPFSHAQRQST